MNIPNKHIKDTINFIVDSCQRALNEQSHLDDERLIGVCQFYKNSLHGLRLLFDEHDDILDLIKNAENSISAMPFQSADACRSPVQSADVVGQGSTSDLSVDSGN